MLPQRLPGILPPMTEEEALESAAVLSLAAQFAPEHWATRLFRAPHHSASGTALVGGGAPCSGEISLAHCGVLCLDELPEFDCHVLEVLCEPLESGRIAISRAVMSKVDLPARFQRIAAMNPCPCGYLAHRTHPSSFTPTAIAKYRDRISDPLLDRIDMRVE